MISNFIARPSPGENVTVTGGRPADPGFSYVSDLVEGLIRLMNRDGVPIPSTWGTPGSFTIVELAEKVLEWMEHACRPSFTGNCRWTIRGGRQPDITRARELLDWQPTVPL